MTTGPFTQKELQVLFAVLTTEKFLLGDIELIYPIAKKIDSLIVKEPPKSPPSKQTDDKIINAVPTQPIKSD